MPVPRAAIAGADALVEQVAGKEEIQNRWNLLCLFQRHSQRPLLHLCLCFFPAAFAKRIVRSDEVETVVQWAWRPLFVRLHLRGRQWKADCTVRMSVNLFFYSP